MFAWNDEVYAWFAAASDYTGFHERLTARLLPHIRQRGSLVDLGCGAGMQALALAPHFGAVTCVDVAEPALAGLRATAKARGIGNVETVRTDAFALAGRTWDVALAMFFGGLDRGLDTWLPLCRDCLVYIVREDVQSGLGPAGYGRHKRSTVDSVRALLDGRGICYTLERDALEYGQPFGTREEAARFVQAFSSEVPEAATRAFLGGRLIETGDARYPLYLPNTKRFGIFIIRRDDNAHAIA